MNWESKIEEMNFWENRENTFEVLNAIDVSEHVEKKNGLDYLAWAWAWKMAKEKYPNAQYKVYENEQGWNYFTDGKTCWVKTSVTIEELEHIEYLPVMNYRNESIPADKVTSFNVNTAIQRSLTKALARHGLGLSVYAGEDIKGQTEPASEPATDRLITTQELSRLITELGKKHITEDAVKDRYKVTDLNRLTFSQYRQCLVDIERSSGNV